VNLLFVLALMGLGVYKIFSRTVSIHLHDATMVAVSKHLKLAVTWIKLLNTLDYDGMASVMSENFISVLKPLSMGFPPVGKQEYIDRLASAPIGYFNVNSSLECIVHRLTLICHTDFFTHD